MVYLKSFDKSNFQDHLKTLHSKFGNLHFELWNFENTTLQYFTKLTPNVAV